MLLIFKNGYTSATGTQDIISTPDDDAQGSARRQAAEPGRHATTTIETTLKGLGVQWLRTVHTYRVGEMRKTLQGGLHHRLRRASR